MNIPKILKEALNRWASDVILSSNTLPCLKINWDVVYLDDYEVFLSINLEEEMLWIMSSKQKEKLRMNLELDFSIDLKSHSRFRVNVFYEKKWIGAVFRSIRNILPSPEDLGLPRKLLDFIQKKNWLVLVTGSVWSWKSTTLASLIDIVNTHLPKHIITVEDPIEFVFENKRSLIEQREVWVNTLTFENGLKYALRQASDVIMIGEMRDLETFRLALRAAETGNLVFATLHTAWAARTIARIIDMFSSDEKDQIKSQLAESLIWVVWQDLLKTKDWKGRVLASEILVNNTAVSNMIRKWLTHQIESAMETWWSSDWMITMKQSLDTLRWKGII